MSEWNGQELRSGAMPDESIQEMDDGYTGLYPGQEAKIAEAILSEPAQGRDGEEPRFYLSDKQLKKSNARRGRGLRQGYGDEAARSGYNARTGE